MCAELLCRIVALTVALDIAASPCVYATVLTREIAFFLRPEVGLWSSDTGTVEATARLFV